MGRTTVELKLTSALKFRRKRSIFRNKTRNNIILRVRKKRTNTRTSGNNEHDSGSCQKKLTPGTAFGNRDLTSRACS